MISEQVSQNAPILPNVTQITIRLFISSLAPQQYKAYRQIWQLPSPGCARSFFVLTSIRVLQSIHSRVSLSLLCITTLHNISEITFVIYYHFSSSAASCWGHIPHAITTWFCCKPQFGLITWSSHGYWQPTSAHRLFMNINQLSHGMVFLRWLVEAHDVIIHTPYLGTLYREIPNRLTERKMVFPQ